MNRIAASGLCLLGLGFANAEGQLAEAGQAELSDAEADAIVRAEYAEKRERERVQLARMKANKILSRKVVNRGGHTLTMEKIEAPPVVRRAAGGVVAQVSEDAPAGPDKPDTMISISATVYDGGAVTEVRWWEGGEGRLAFSNADFSLLRGVTRLETEGAVFSFFMGIGEGERAADGRGDLPPVPPAGSISEVAGSYVVAIPGDADSDKEFLAGLDALHLHYRENERELRVADQRRGALAKARQRHRAANPSKKENAVIQFWRKSGGGAQGGAGQ